jgi:hypothetical protein
VNHYFSLLSKTPSRVSNWYAQNAELDWMSGPPGKTGTRVLGKGAIHQFLKAVPEMIYEVETYDCHTIERLTVLVITGKAAPVGKQSTVYPFHTTMHLAVADGRATVRCQSFMIFSPG